MWGLRRPVWERTAGPSEAWHVGRPQLKPMLGEGEAGRAIDYIGPAFPSGVLARPQAQPSARPDTPCRQDFSPSENNPGA